MSLDITLTKERHPGRWVALIIVVIVLGAAGWFGYKWYTTGEEVPIPLPVVSADSRVDESSVNVADHTVDDIQLRYLRIPSLGVESARVLAVTTDQYNVLQFAGNINDVGWFEESATPGSGGVIIVNGHGKGVRASGPFVALESLAVGSDIIVERGDGEIFVYTVADKKVLPYDEANTTGMINMGKSATPGTEALNIIAPTGTWLPRVGTFEDRVMLRSVLQE